MNIKNQSVNETIKELRTVITTGIENAKNDVSWSIYNEAIAVRDGIINMLPMFVDTVKTKINDHTFYEFLQCGECTFKTPFYYLHHKKDVGEEKDVGEIRVIFNSDREFTFYVNLTTTLFSSNDKKNYLDHEFECKVVNWLKNHPFFSRSAVLLESIVFNPYGNMYIFEIPATKEAVENPAESVEVGGEPDNQNFSLPD